MLEISQRNLLIKFLQFSSCKPGSCTKKGSNIKQSVIYSMHNQKVPSVENYEKSIGCTKKVIFVNLTLAFFSQLSTYIRSMVRDGILPDMEKVASMQALLADNF